MTAMEKLEKSTGNEMTITALMVNRLRFIKVRLFFISLEIINLFIIIYK
jgi:hypothetical protein